MSDALDALELSAAAFGRLRYLLSQFGATPGDGPQLPLAEVLGPYWKDRAGFFETVTGYVRAFAPLSLTGASLSADGAVAVAIADAKGRPIIIRVTFDEADLVHRLSWSRPPPEGVSIRVATPDDIPALAELERECPIVTDGGRSFATFRPNLAEMFALQGGLHMLVAERDRRLVAMSGSAFRDVVIDGAVRTFRLSQLMSVRPTERNHNLTHCFGRYEMELFAPQADYFYAHVDEGNAALVHSLRGMMRYDWKRRVKNLFFECAPAEAPSFGRSATSSDLPRIAALMNAAHMSKAMYSPSTADTLAARLSRTPNYGLAQLLVSDHAAIGVWQSGEQIEDRKPTGVTRRRLATILDYGFEGDRGLDELGRLVTSAAARCAARGATHLALFTDDVSPEFMRLAPLAVSIDSFIFRCRRSEPTDRCSLYTDAVFI